MGDTAYNIHYNSYMIYVTLLVLLMEEINSDIKLMVIDTGLVITL